MICPPCSLQATLLLVVLTLPPLVVLTLPLLVVRTLPPLVVLIPLDQALDSQYQEGLATLLRVQVTLPLVPRPLPSHPMEVGVAHCPVQPPFLYHSPSPPPPPQHHSLQLRTTLEDLEWLDLALQVGIPLLEVTQGNSPQLVTQGNNRQLVTLDNSPQLVTRGNRRQRVIRGNSHQRVTRGNSHQLVTRDNSRQLVTQGNSHQLVTRDNSRQGNPIPSPPVPQQ